ncbi:MAG: histidine phosphatase family protein [Pseudomonadota bacterium]
MIFIRHPKTEAPDGLCYGRLDIGLGPEAPAQIARALETVPKGPVVTSPALRCQALAEPLAGRNDDAVLNEDPRLWEMNFGAWEGMMWADIPRDQSDPWAKDAMNLAPPDGESFSEVLARVGAAIADAPENAIIVAHAGVIRAVQMTLLGWSFEQVFAAKVPYAEPIRMVRQAA